MSSILGDRALLKVEVALKEFALAIDKGAGAGKGEAETTLD